MAQEVLHNFNILIDLFFPLDPIIKKSSLDHIIA